MDRRHAIGSGLAAGVGTLLTGGDTAAATAEQATESSGIRIAAAISQLQQAFERQFDSTNLGPSRTIDALREQQRVYLRANQKYPDFIEVGLNVWDDVYDWHVKHRQPISATRLGDGRYAMTFMFTTLILRHDMTEGYVGFGFDTDARGVRR